MVESCSVEAWAMSGIQVSVRPPTNAGRLYTHYDSKAHVLVAGSRETRRWPYGINVDAMLICDLDDERVLANFDLHYDRDRWPTAPDVRWPESARAADLVFDEESVAKKNFPGPVEVRSNQTRSVVEIRLDPRDADETVALSDGCVALLREHELVGFVVKIV